MSTHALQDALHQYMNICSLFVVVPHVSHCSNDEGYDRHASNGANYNRHHVLFWNNNDP